MTITYTWRGHSDDAALDALHAEGFGHPAQGAGWAARLHGHSLGWVCARHDGDGDLVGFVNVAWDGGAHAFLLDTVVAPGHRGAAVGSRLVAEAARGARAAGCAWLHVDFEGDLKPFYFDACGFRPTAAGLIPL
ncbi:GNAT family N-acetyltransferase [Streptomyces sp. NRRL WC-3549]|uniref:GNAT family N-acetyltransferase n=1 Tax=Streptomyces sp. NRRL WC-3549 TaxID=1463925 RepID=UPI0004C833DC|nr:GNAT family N-acetyltransferase [Streptomyces sp. NRRL WC-3549]